MYLTPSIELAGYESLDQLSSIVSPVAPSHPDQRSYIDVIVGLRRLEVHADTELAGWRLLTCEPTRFEIAQDTTGRQLACALNDARVITAIEMVMDPPSPAIGLKRAELAKLTGSETFDRSVDELISALSQHLFVIREKLCTGTKSNQPHTQPDLF